MRILIVEDDAKMAALLEKGLRGEGHFVAVERTGPDGWEAAHEREFDVIVLDVMLPKMDGFELARRLRQGKNATPILMLTARDALADKVQGLDWGADDYLTKPFLFDEFLARIRAAARRGPTPRLPTLAVADLVLDPAAHEVLRKGQAITLTRTEFLLLELLMRNVDRVVGRDSILTALWDSEESVEDSNLNAFMSLLRKKIDQRGEPSLIETVRGVGYRMRRSPA